MADSSAPIHGVVLYRCEVPLEVRYASDSMTTAHVLVVELQAENCHGWGEVMMPRAAPVFARAQQVAPLLIGQDALALDTLLELFPGERPRMTLDECGTYCHPDVDGAAEAFSIALHDLVGRLQRRSVASLLGPIARTVIPGMPVVPLAAPAEMAAAAAAWTARGATALKVKLAGNAAADIAALQQVRAAVGTGVGLQVDANGAYPSVLAARPLIAALAEVGVDVVEDLFDIGALAVCREARPLLTGRYMVDKDAHWPAVNQVIAAGVADIINQHPHNQGALSTAMRIAAAAADAGIDNAIGSSGILGIQNAAFLHLAAVTGLSRPCEDVGLHSYWEIGPLTGMRFAESPSVLVAPPPFEDGQLRLPRGDGLGVEVDRERLGRACRAHTAFGSAGRAGSAVAPTA
jgi:glucarate dehydratase